MGVCKFCRRGMGVGRILAQKGSPPEPEPAPVLVPTSARTTVKEVIEAYLGRCKSRGIQALNLARHKTLTNQLGAYSTDQSYSPLSKLK